jgi:hypothetical protein
MVDARGDGPVTIGKRAVEIKQHGGIRVQQLRHDVSEFKQGRARVPILLSWWRWFGNPVMQEHSFKPTNKIQQK